MGQVLHGHRIDFLEELETLGQIEVLSLWAENLEACDKGKIGVFCKGKSE